MIGSPLARHASRPPNTTRRIWPASRSCLSGAGSCHHNTTSDGQRQVPDWKGEVVEHSGPHVLGHGTEKERDEAERRGNARLGRPRRNPRSPTAPAAFSAPNIGSHAVETPSCAEFFRTNVADAKSASAHADIGHDSGDGVDRLGAHGSLFRLLLRCGVPRTSAQPCLLSICRR
jgi:hypothetical protein